MNHYFIHTVKAEWIKKRRSFADWLVLAGGFFVPLLLIIILICFPKQLLSIHASGHFWEQVFDKAWQMMAFMLLPMGIVLAVSLVVQIEFRNNSWKQVHTSPVPFASIYFSKLLVLLVMLLQLFLLFNIGIFLAGMIPSLLNSHTKFPAYTVNYVFFLERNLHYFITCLPMVALQYMLSLKFKNFLVPIGAGLALTTGALIALSWKYIYMIPSSYTALYYLQSNKSVPPAHNLLLWSLGYFVFFSLLGYWLYVSGKEKG